MADLETAVAAYVADAAAHECFWGAILIACGNEVRLLEAHNYACRRFKLPTRFYLTDLGLAALASSRVSKSLS